MIYRSFLTSLTPRSSQRRQLAGSDGTELMRTRLRNELELLLRTGTLDEAELRKANARGHSASFRSRRLSRARVPGPQTGVAPTRRPYSPVKLAIAPSQRSSACSTCER